MEKNGMTLKFNQDVFSNGKKVYSKDEVKVIDDSRGTASRWIRRGVALEEASQTKNNKDLSKQKSKGQDKNVDEEKATEPKADNQETVDL